MSDIKKLPVWAQKVIKDLMRERDTAIDALNRHLNEERPSPFYVEEHLCTGEERGITRKVRYIQAPQRMKVKHAGVELDIILRDEAIELSYDEPDYGNVDVCLRPTSYQRMELIARKNMRRRKNDN